MQLCSKAIRSYVKNFKFCTQLFYDEGRYYIETSPLFALQINGLFSI